MKISITEMEEMLRGKRVPADMLSSESLAAYVLRRFYALTQKLEAAEAELARRDAAGEPVGTVLYAPLTGFTVDWTGGPVSAGDKLYSIPTASLLPNSSIAKALHDCDWSGTSIGNKAIILAAIKTLSAPPVVLPPERPVHLDMSRIQIMKNIEYNQCRADAIALGAQQQKVVELPPLSNAEENFYGVFGEGYEAWLEAKTAHAVWNECLKRCFAALDAANVKWEVKK